MVIDKSLECINVLGGQDKFDDYGRGMKAYSCCSLVCPSLEETIKKEIKVDFSCKQFGNHKEFEKCDMTGQIQTQIKTHLHSNSNSNRTSNSTSNPNKKSNIYKFITLNKC